MNFRTRQVTNSIALNEGDAAKNDNSKTDHNAHEPPKWIVRQQGRFLMTWKPPKGSLAWRDVDLEVQDVVSGKLLWKRHFDKEPPGIRVNAQTGTMLMIWGAWTDSAKQLIHSDEALKAAWDRLQMREGAELLVVVEGTTGKPLGKLLLQTGKGSFHIEAAQASGDWITITDDQNRVLLYSLSSGEQKAVFFGGKANLSVAPVCCSPRTAPDR